MMGVLEVPAVWRSLMYLMCLVAALAGTPLRQAEAADDIARSLAESGDVHALGMIDGGVGDDTGETVLNAGAGDHAAPDAIAPGVLDVLTLPPASPLPGRIERSRDDRAATFPMASARRHAWLQCFLF